VVTILTACSGSPTVKKPDASPERADQETLEETTQELADGASADTDETAVLSVAEARKIAQGWVDTHPFQLGSNLEPGSGEQIVNGVEYYSFGLGVVRYSVVGILVHKETGVLYHFTSPGNNTFEPLDDWYNREHNPSLWADNLEWITVFSDSMSISIPATWTFDISDENSDWGIPGEIWLANETGSIDLFVGYLVAGGPENYLAENPHTTFLFDAGDEGYMIENADAIFWLHPYWGESGVALWHNGDNSIFTNNKDLILQIVRSLRAIQ